MNVQSSFVPSFAEFKTFSKFGVRLRPNQMGGILRAHTSRCGRPGFTALMFKELFEEMKRDYLSCDILSSLEYWNGGVEIPSGVEAFLVDCNFLTISVKTSESSTNLKANVSFLFDQRDANGKAITAVEFQFVDSELVDRHGVLYAQDSRKNEEACVINLVEPTSFKKNELVASSGVIMNHHGLVSIRNWSEHQNSAILNTLVMSVVIPHPERKEIEIVSDVYYGHTFSNSTIVLTNTPPEVLVNAGLGAKKDLSSSLFDAIHIMSSFTNLGRHHEYRKEFGDFTNNIPEFPLSEGLLGRVLKSKIILVRTGGGHTKTGSKKSHLTISYGEGQRKMNEIRVDMYKANSNKKATNGWEQVDVTNSPRNEHETRLEFVGQINDEWRSIQVTFRQTA